MAKEPKRPHGSTEFGTTLEETIITDALIGQRRNLLPIRRKLDRMYGESEWGENELRAYIARSEWDKKVARDKWNATKDAPGAPEAPEAKTGAPATLSNFDLDTEAERFMQDYPDLGEINRPMVRQLILYNRLLVNLAEQMESEIIGKDPTAARRTQQMMTAIQSEVRQIHKVLGLDAGSLRSGGAEERRQEILQTMDRAKALLNKSAVRITCPACLASSQERVINLGYVLYHFKEEMPFHWWTLCPHPDCGQGIHIHGGPGRETVIENGPRTMGPLRR